MSDKTQNPIVRLENVRLSYPSLFHARVDRDSKDNPDKVPKFEATAILDKKANAADIAKVQAAIKVCRASPVMKGRPPNKVCLRDGADTPARAEAEGYGPNVMSVSARNRNRPAVVDRRLNPITEESGKLYPGCYVNMTMEIYPMSHPKSGPMVCASLRAVQFVRDGKPLGDGPVDASKEFEDMGDSEGNVDGDESPV